MKVQMLGVLAVVASATAFAGGEYYVDPRGDNGWTGTADWEHRDTSVTPAIGPRKWLSEAMKLTKDNNGDVVYAAPGHYDEGSKDGYRVVLTEGTRLIATGKKEETFIKGEIDTTVALDASPFGCGPNALRCVNIPNKAQVIGFTICNGRAPAYNSDMAYVCGGVMMAEAKYDAIVADCVISNCVAARAGGTRFGIAVRCRFDDNRGGTSGAHAWATTCYNCWFGNGNNGNGAQSSMLVNCRNEGSTTVDCTSYNCDLRSSVTRGTISYCRYQYTSSSPNNPTIGEGCKQVVKDADMKVDADGRPVKGANDGIDKGDFLSYTNGASAAVMAFLDKDFALGQRVYNCTIDIGCGEYDPRADWAAALSNHPEGFSVAEASGDVTLSSGAVRISAESTFKTSWTSPVANAVVYDCSFVAEAADGATLKVYLDGADEPFAVVRSGDGSRTVSYKTLESHELRFVVEGAGTVSLSSFAFSWTLCFYVDPRGDNEWDGSVPYEQRDEVAKIGPRKWLSEAMKLTKDNNGDVVYAAPGHYDEGSKDGYRVVLTQGTKLIASGAKEETFIEGEIDTTVAQDGTPFGCGANALRCVNIPDKAQVIGFTICNGRAPAYSENMAYVCGGVMMAEAKYDALVADCVISNCVAARAGGTRFGIAVRCRFDNNRGGTSGAHAWATRCYNCWFGTAYGYGVQSGTLLNCRNEGSTTVQCTSYNCDFRGDVNQGSISYCRYKYLSSTSPTLVIGNKQVVQDAGMSVDADGRPVKGANDGIDKGDFVSYTNGASAAVMEFLEKDFAHGQRVYNGAIDIGCGEYDWRGDFGRKLAKKGVEVVAASEGVTTNLVAGLDVPAGKPLKMKFVLQTSGEVSFKVSAEAGTSAAVTVDGSALAIGDDGWCRFSGEEGECEVEVAVTGPGKATVSDVTLPKFGAVLIVR